MQVSFIFGYSMKLQSVVKTMGGVRALTLPFSTPIQNTLVHDLTVKVSIIWTPEMVRLVHSDPAICTAAMCQDTNLRNLFAICCVAIMYIATYLCPENPNSVVARLPFSARRCSYRLLAVAAGCLTEVFKAMTRG